MTTTILCSATFAKKLSVLSNAVVSQATTLDQEPLVRAEQLAMAQVCFPFSLHKPVTDFCSVLCGFVYLFVLAVAVALSLQLQLP